MSIGTPSTYETTDLYLGCFLKASGFRLLDAKAVIPTESHGMQFAGIVAAWHHD